MNFKKLAMAVLIVLMIAGLSWAGDVTLAWDANNPTPDGYRLFYREITAQYDYATPAWTGTATQGTITGLSEGVTYAFVCRAYVGSNESGDSNEVVYTVQAPPQQIVIPQRVNGIRIIFE